MSWESQQMTLVADQYFVELEKTYHQYPMSTPELFSTRWNYALTKRLRTV